MLAIACALLAVSFNTLCAFPGQKTTTKDRHSARQTPASKWAEDKVDVKVEKPLLSQSGHLVLVYTVTNKTGKDFRISRDRSQILMPPDAERVTLFLKLKNPSTYSEVSEKTNFLVLPDKLLPAGIPVRLEVFVRLREDSKPSWLSRESEQRRLRAAVDTELGNTESIALLLPNRRLKITLPIPKVQ